MRSRTGFAFALACLGILLMTHSVAARPAASAHAHQQPKHKSKKPAAVPVQHPAAPAPRSTFDWARAVHQRAQQCRPGACRASTQIHRHQSDRAQTALARGELSAGEAWLCTTNSDAAKSFAYYGKRIPEPQIGAIAVLMRGHNGGHGGVVSGVDAKGDPIIISRNHTRTGVGEGVYARSRVIAYVLPTEQRVCARGRRPSGGGAERRLPDAALLAAINAEARVPAHVQPPRPQAAPPPARQPVAPFGGAGRAAPDRAADARAARQPSRERSIFRIARRRRSGA